MKENLLYQYCYSSTPYNSSSIFKDDMDNLKNLLSEDSFRRIESFKESNLEIYPEENIYSYTVISHKEEGHDIKHVEVDESDLGTCTCEDNFYRGIECKHIWGIRLFSKHNIIPNPGDSRLIWYIDELRELQETLDDDRSTIIQSIIDDLRDKEFKHFEIKQIAKLIKKYKLHQLEKEYMEKTN